MSGYVWCVGGYAVWTYSPKWIEEKKKNIILITIYVYVCYLCADVWPYPVSHPYVVRSFWCSIVSVVDDDECSESAVCGVMGLKVVAETCKKYMKMFRKKYFEKKNEKIQKVNEMEGKGERGKKTRELSSAEKWRWIQRKKGTTANNWQRNGTLLRRSRWGVSERSIFFPSSTSLDYLFCLFQFNSFPSMNRWKILDWIRWICPFGILWFAEYHTNGKSVWKGKMWRQSEISYANWAAWLCDWIYWYQQNWGIPVLDHK